MQCRVFPSESMIEFEALSNSTTLNYCLSSCSNSVQTDQFNTIFSILTSPDHQALRRGFIYKSQIQSIALSFEAIQINGIRNCHYFILWNESLLFSPDLDTVEGNRRHLRSRGRSSSAIGSVDVRRRRVSFQDYGQIFFMLEQVGLKLNTILHSQNQI
jgi:hypothetical protein